MTTPDALFWGGLTVIPAIVAFGASWGYLKGKMHNYVDFETHRKICLERADASKEADKDIREETRVMVSEIHSDIKELIRSHSDLSGYVRGLQQKH